MKRIAALAATLAVMILPAGARGAGGESVEAIEKDLASILAEMETIRSELDRIGEIAALPKATGLRVEIYGGVGVPAPAAGRLIVQGRAEDEREWSLSEREAFPGGAPLVVQIPFFPGVHPGRIEVAHPSWKTPAAAEFRVSIGMGETPSLRFRLSAQPGKAEPALAAIPEK